MHFPTPLPKQRPADPTPHETEAELASPPEEEAIHTDDGPAIPDAVLRAAARARAALSRAVSAREQAGMFAPKLD